MVAKYHVEHVGAAKVAGIIVDALDQLACEGARRMLQANDMAPLRGEPGVVATRGVTLDVVGELNRGTVGSNLRGFSYS